MAAGQQTSVWADSMYNRYDFVKFEEFPAAKQQIDFDSIDYPLLNAAVFYETNRQRALKDLPPLMHAEVLERLATDFSNDMVEHDFFSHSSPLPGKENFQARLETAGIEDVPAAENIATVFAIQYEAGTPVYTPDQNQGYFSYNYRGEPIQNHTYLGFAKATLKHLQGAGAHQDNILSPAYHYLGVGAAHFQDTAFYDIDQFKLTQIFTESVKSSNRKLIKETAP
jgi:hypothetical protein